MNLQYCSITGADDAVAVDDLSRMAAEFPFVEWAILLLPAQAGQARCPTRGWIKAFIRDYRGQHTAMHLCDDALLGFIAGDPAILDLMSGFGRVQLNLKFGNVAGRYAVDDLVSQVRKYPQFQFILQYTPDRRDMLELFKDIPNHAVLFDASAGTGVSPERWDIPLPGHACGYAGGIGPDNVTDHLNRIARVAPGYTTWIDMESGVRTDDRFDLAKVRRVMEAAAPFVL